jgi:hypothetical protein
MHCHTTVKRQLQDMAAVLYRQCNRNKCSISLHRVLLTSIG